MRLSPHFTLAEFACRDGTSVPARLRPRTRRLCQLVLEKVRAKLGGRRATVSSGYRSPAYNRGLKKAARFSQHMEGTAADLTVERVSAKDVHDTALQMYRDGEIPELMGLGRYPTFTHFDVRATPPGDTRLRRWGGSRRRN